MTNTPSLAGPTITFAVWLSAFAWIMVRFA